MYIHVRSCSFCYVLNPQFYIFKNLIDFIIFLDILSRIGTLFKYFFLQCFTSLRYLLVAFFIITTIFYNIFYPNNFTLSKCYLENINININKSHMPLCLTNNVFLFIHFCFFCSQRFCNQLQSCYLLSHRSHFVKYFLQRR